MQSRYSATSLMHFKFYGSRHHSIAKINEDDTIENDIGWSKLLFFARIYLAKIFEAINTLEYLWHKYKKMYSEKITKECRSAIEHLLIKGIGTELDT